VGSHSPGANPEEGHGDRPAEPRTLWLTKDQWQLVLGAVVLAALAYFFIIAPSMSDACRGCHADYDARVAQGEHPSIGETCVC